MDTHESNIRRLLNGQHLEGELLCDFTLKDQNEATVAKGIQPSTSSDYVPVCKHTVTYVVMGVLLNDQGEVLMMQEAKESCAGQWYLPAGRMEPGETIEQAVKREVLEETGLEFEPTTLLMVETGSGSWFRFVLTGRVIGGKLKTPAQADSESLQAKWVKNLSELSMRAKDVMDVIEKAKAFHQKSSTERWHDNLLPQLYPHTKLLMRLVICIKQRSSNRVHVLLSEKNVAHLPMFEIYPSKNIHSTLRRFMVEIFGADLAMDSHKPHGLLCVEHTGKPESKNDGLLLTVLISFRIPLEDVYPIDKYSWHMVSKELEELLNVRIRKNMTVGLRVLR